MLFESSTESEGISGLGAFQGDCQKFTQGKVPQIGWNQIQKQENSLLLNSIENQRFLYFLHGYYIRPKDKNIVTATTEYGITYPSMIEKGNVYGVQFHPEKSGEWGLKLLKNWVELC